jgi:hypothetical protein
MVGRRDWLAVLVHGVKVAPVLFGGLYRLKATTRSACGDGLVLVGLPVLWAIESRLTKTEAPRR